MLRCSFTVLCVVCLVLLGAGPVSATYLTITDVTPGWSCTLNPSGALGVNATGQATGPGYGPDVAISPFFWNGSTVAELGKGPYTNQARSYGINAGGTIVGYGLVPQRAWYKTTSGSITQLPYLPSGTTSTAYAINTAGEIGGYSNGPGYTRGTVWSSATGSYTAYDIIGGAGASGATTALLNGTCYVTALKDGGGLAVGYSNYNSNNYPFYSTYSISSGGALTATNYDLSSISVIGAAKALAVNSNNQIVGQTVSGAQAFLYTIGGSKMSLGYLGAGTQSSAQGINDSGTVVGWSYTDSGNTTMRAMIWDSVNGMRDLNTLINPASGWTLTAAYAIKGNYVSGVGTIGGVNHGFVINLVPEPSTLLLAAGTLAGLLVYGWRKRK